MMKRYFEKFLDKFITIIERGGNALPHPAALFGIIALITLVISAIGHYSGWQGINPASGNTVKIINLFMGSASAKWAIMGLVFIPMFMLLGYSPEYRHDHRHNVAVFRDILFHLDVTFDFLDNNRLTFGP